MIEFVREYATAQNFAAYVLSLLTLVAVFLPAVVAGPRGGRYQKESKQ